jgi:WD40 repeat protein
VATVEPVTSLPAHQGDVAIEFASGGARLITRQSRRSSPPADDNGGEPPEPAVGPDPTDAEDGLVRIFETETGRLVATLGTFDSFSLSPSERRLLTLAKGGQAALWDAATGQQVRAYQLPESTDSISFPASDATAAFRAGSASVQYFQISDGALLTEEQARLVDARSQSDYAVIEKAGKLSPDGKRVVEGHDYKGNLRISLKAPGQEKPIAELETGGSAGVFDAKFSPDSQKLVTTAPFSQAKIWEARSGQLLHVLKGHSSFVTSVAFVNDGRNVLTTSRDGSIRIWSADTGDELQVFSGHSDVPRHGHLSPDGARLLTVGESSARLWRGEPFRGPTLRFASPLTIRADATVVSADGSRVLLVTTDNVLHVLSIGDQLSIRAIRVGPPSAQQWCEPSSNPAATGRPSGARTTAAALVDSDQTMPNRHFWFTMAWCWSARPRTAGRGRRPAGNAPGG